MMKKIILDVEITWDKQRNVLRVQHMGKASLSNHLQAT